MHDALAVVLHQPVVEVEHAGDEVRREDADAAIVEQIEARGRAGVVEPGGIVAEMRVAVDDAVAAERPPPGMEQRAGKQVARLQGGVGEIEQRLGPRAMTW
jgi:hypothetical protein